MSRENNVAVPDQQSRSKKEIAKLIARAFAELLLTAASVVLYFDATKKNSWIIKTDSIGVNSLINLLGVHQTIDALLSLLKEKKYAKFSAFLLFSLATSAPFAVVAAATSNSLKMQIISAVSTELGFAALNGMSLNALISLFSKKQYNPVITNLGRLERYLTLGNLYGMTAPTSPADAIEKIAQRYQLEKTFPNVPRIISYPGKALAVLFKSTLSLTTAFCIFIYMCATAAGLKKDLFKHISKRANFIIGNTLLSPLLALGLKSGWNAAGNLIDTLYNLVQYRKISNKFSASGSRIFSAALALVIAGALSFDSGWPTKNFYDNDVQNTTASAISDQPILSWYAYASSVIFNFIFAFQCAYMILSAALNRFDSTSGKYYKTTIDMLEKKHKEIEARPEKISAMRKHAQQFDAQLQKLNKLASHTPGSEPLLTAIRAIETQLEALRSEIQKFNDSDHFGFADGNPVRSLLFSKSEREFSNNLEACCDTSTIAPPLSARTDVSMDTARDQREEGVVVVKIDDNDSRANENPGAGEGAELLRDTNQKQAGWGLPSPMSWFGSASKQTVVDTNASAPAPSSRWCSMM